MLPYLIVFRSQFVQTFLNDVVTIQVFDQNHDVKTQGDDYRVDLSIVSKISLPPLT